MGFAQKGKNAFFTSYSFMVTVFCRVQLPKGDKNKIT
jgi:hypothetical protein